MWKQSEQYDHLTICMFSRNLKSLCYPIFESIASTFDLGCRYLIGDCSNDGTKDLWVELANYFPLEVIHFDWPLDKEPGWMAAALGLCTQRVFDKCPTRVGYNLQASEVLDAEAVESIKSKGKDVTISSFLFRHFYGSMHIGGVGYSGYPQAPRIFFPGTKFDKTDAYLPNEWDGIGVDYFNTHVNRYGYCWRNTILGKNMNKNRLYDGSNNTPESCQKFHEWGRDEKNWMYPREAHPQCVQHLIDLVDYDFDSSKSWFIESYCK